MKIWIQAALEEAGENVFKCIHGAGLEVNDRCYAIEVSTFGNRQDATKVTNIQLAPSGSGG